jgi:hypothetical protein
MCWLSRQTSFLGGSGFAQGKRRRSMPSRDGTGLMPEAFDERRAARILESR